MVDPVSGAPTYPPAREAPAFVPSVPAPAEVEEPGAPLPDPPLGAPGPPAGAADVAVRYRSAVQALDDPARGRTEFWA